MQGIEVPLLLVTTALGYKVCVVASEKKGGLKKAGYAIGIVIVAASLLSLGCILYALHCIGSSNCDIGSKPMMGMRASCPVK